MSKTARKKKPAPKEPEKKLSLGVGLKNFGPIADGEIKLRPLTVLVGPNNSGKSFGALFVHSALRTINGIILWGEPINLVSEYLRMQKIENMPPQMLAATRPFRDIVLQVRDTSQATATDVRKALRDIITADIFEHYIPEAFKRELTAAFGVSVESLVRSPNKRLEIDINFGQSSVKYGFVKKKGAFNLKQLSIPDLEISVQTGSSQTSALESINTPNSLITWRASTGESGMVPMPDGHDSSYKTDTAWFIARWKLFKQLATALSEGSAARSYYLPAARSGILHGHKALAAAIVNQASFAGLSDFEIPRVSSSVATLISDMLSMGGEPGPFFDLSEQIEQEMTGGTIVLYMPSPGMYPEIKFKYEGGVISLQTCSSMISELAPLFLYLRYKVKPGDVLIVEEPEAHLHPKNQRIIAKLFARLIRQGVYVLITTHSEYLVQQIQNLVSLSKLDSAVREKKYRYDKNDFLRQEEVGAYLFTWGRKSRGYKTKELTISDEEGVTEEGFGDVHDALYEETIGIERALQEKGAPGSG